MPQDDATTHFVQTLVANGQAARANVDGSLPPGVTHEIVGDTASGVPIVRRRRFSMYCGSTNFALRLTDAAEK